MADWGAYITGCLGSCRLAGLAFLFSVGILLQILVFFLSTLFHFAFLPVATCGSVWKN
jgi:hypothetical protein